MDCAAPAAAGPCAPSRSLGFAADVFAADLDGDGDLNALSAHHGGALLQWHENVGALIFADGFDSGGDTACRPQSVP